jgi:cob(I)alamin adenosyltransferase
MTKIYTKTGDLGETSLLSGKRVTKDYPAIDLYGEIDSLNSWIGLLQINTPKDHVSLGINTKLQNELFVLGSLLACEPSSRNEWKLPSLNKFLVEELETTIDYMNKSLPELKNFILPGGSLASAYAHLCRTHTRKCERKILGYNRQTNDEIAGSIILLNRMSDYFFVLARSLNAIAKVQDVVWKLN